MQFQHAITSWVFFQMKWVNCIYSKIWRSKMKTRFYKEKLSNYVLLIWSALIADQNFPDNQSATTIGMRAVIVTQLVDWSLLILEVRGSNPVIGKLLCKTFVFCQLYLKDKKATGNCPSKTFYWNWTLHSKRVICERTNPRSRPHCWFGVRGCRPFLTRLGKRGNRVSVLKTQKLNFCPISSVHWRDFAFSVVTGTF